MKKSFSLTIPIPCSEKWENFEPMQRGRFCSSCGENVIDFTSFTEEELIEYFKSAPKNVCGRLRHGQLSNYPIESSFINPGWRLWKAGVLAIGLAMLSRPSVAQVTQERPRSEQNENRFATERKIKEGANSISIHGIVYDTEDNALPGVTVALLGSDRFVYTDADGKFTFSDLKDGDQIQFSFIGLLPQTNAVVGFSGSEMVIHMSPDIEGLNELVIMGGICTTRKISFRRWWWKLKGLFS